jgi:hypothetical protein
MGSEILRPALRKPEDFGTVRGRVEMAGALAPVPREVAMRLVNHSSELVHQIYQREKIEDVLQWRDAVRVPLQMLP